MKVKAGEFFSAETIFVNTAGYTKIRMFHRCVFRHHMLFLCGVARIRHTQLTILLHREIQMIFFEDFDSTIIAL
jgi:hypothetical protein